MINKKKKVLKEMKVKEKVEKILTEFSTSEETFRFLDVSHRRSEYQQSFDKAFYKQTITCLNKLGDLLVLTNANRMFHLWAYKETVLSHETTIRNLYKTILKTIKDYENKNL
tara:strand:- start:6818 stop:7153 length:336 start_codon:yes stop_codon:yes gene_type:complete